MFNNQSIIAQSNVSLPTELNVISQFIALPISKFNFQRIEKPEIANQGNRNHFDKFFVEIHDSVQHTFLGFIVDDFEVSVGADSTINAVFIRIDSSKDIKQCLTETYGTESIKWTAYTLSGNLIEDTGHESHFWHCPE